MKLDVVNIDNKIVGEVELEDAIFKAPVNEPVMHQVVRMQLANRRRGTASTKRRAEVRGGGSKPWRQKGTGRARSGSNTSPLWIGGGVIFGPQPRSYAFSVPKKIKRLALKSALSSKLANGELIVLKELNFSKPCTRDMAQIIRKLDIDGRVLIVDEKRDMNLVKSSRNIPGVKVLPVAGLNVYDMLLVDKLLILQPALEAIKNRLM
jgi:large subunit ribosomal protein L4